MFLDITNWEYSISYYLAALLAGYLLGSIPFGLVLTQIAGHGDIRSIGSGNIGATNVLRTGNKGLALATLLLDGGKGAIAVLIVNLFWVMPLAIFAGLGAFLGHIFPVWLKFQGGKGIATLFGITFAWDWQVGVVAGLTWLAVAYLTKYSSLAALITVILTPLYFWVFGDYDIVPFSVLIAILVFLRHRENIDRLIAGTETKIGQNKSEET